MPAELDFSDINIAERLEEWKHEEGRIWGDLKKPGPRRTDPFEDLRGPCSLGQAGTH